MTNKLREDLLCWIHSDCFVCFHAAREEQLTEVERELDNVRRRYRESQQRISNLETNVDTLQVRYSKFFLGLESIIFIFLLLIFKLFIFFVLFSATNKQVV
jgi:uncharacterized protein Yka (UPF0111/DUF47 family)